MRHRLLQIVVQNWASRRHRHKVPRAAAQVGSGPSRPKINAACLALPYHLLGLGRPGTSTEVAASQHSSLVVGI